MKSIFYNIYCGTTKDPEVISSLDELAAAIVAELPNDAISAAQFQGFLREHKHDPQEAKKAVGKWKKQFRGRENSVDS
ncbi:hypothetical protein EMCG_05717 [[Emmonsia] crescens]|uniref:Mitochondrial chaperone BCS1-like ATPase lid domain-containing protein n=1 Tax=[Emmonsia] crescens TaxID=73230 RepID=A0A0G2IDD0_9EURO|nr:hypothetical protein EMCG_05717 [Emmonsia crescens UAMH 3008]